MMTRTPPPARCWRKRGDGVSDYPAYQPTPPEPPRLVAGRVVLPMQAVLVNCTAAELERLLAIDRALPFPQLFNEHGAVFEVHFLSERVTDDPVWQPVFERAREHHADYVIVGVKDDPLWKEQA